MRSQLIIVAIGLGTSLGYGLAFGQSIPISRPVVEPLPEYLEGGAQIQPIELMAFPAGDSIALPPAVPPNAQQGAIQQAAGNQPMPLPAGFLNAHQITAAINPQPNAETQAKIDRYIEEAIEPEATIDLLKGRTRTLILKEIPTRYQIADESIAEASFVNDHHLSILARGEGTTVLNLWFANGADPADETLLSYLIRVVPDPQTAQRLEQTYKLLEAEINRNFPDSVVKLSIVGERILVQGQAHDVEQATFILQIVSQSIPDEEAASPEPLDPESGEIPPFGFIGSNFGQSLLRGGNNTGINAGQINSRVINMLRVPGEQQVMLKVTVADVSRNAMRSIGADLQIGNLVGSSAGFFTLLPTGTAGGNLFVNRGDFELAINALRTLGLARTLAEPNLVTLNGQPARFQAGNAFPTQQISGFTAAGLEGTVFNPIGVQLQFLPVITDKDRIRLTITSAVSKIDDANFNGSGNPSLEQRGFSTIVELRDGETLAVAGLIQNTFESASSRVPLFGDIPVLGRLFSADTTELDERELVILVTPHLVAPFEDCNNIPPLPGFDMVEPDDCEFYLLGRIESHNPIDYRSTIRTDISRMKAFRNMQQQVIVGPSGYCQPQ